MLLTLAVFSFLIVAVLCGHLLERWGKRKGLHEPPMYHYVE